MQTVQTYRVYLPDGKTMMAKTAKARGDWAIANVRRKNGRWAVMDIFDATAEDHRGPLVVTAERMGEV